MRAGSELAEAAGTFALVLAGCGAIIVDAQTGALGHVGVSATFGLVIGAMIYATGHLSGAHFNPAVTLAFAATRHFPWRRVPGYVAAQLLGALAAALVLRAALGNVAHLGATVPGELVTLPGWLLVEFLLTATLMFVIASVATDGRAVGAMAGTAIGGTVALSALWAGPLTGASMNPARSLGPAVASGAADALGALWAYLVVPVLGALAGALLYEAVRRGSRPAPVRRPESPDDAPRTSAAPEGVA